MTPEARDYLDKAAEDLADAQKILGIGLAKPAARGAYYAAFHAAEALLVARTGRIAKTHSGLRTALAQLLRDGDSDDREMLSFLARAYKYKEVSDYSVGLTTKITLADAETVIDGARKFLESVIEMLAADPTDIV